MTKDLRDNKRSRHITRKFHYIRDRVEDRNLVVKRLSLAENPTDPFTKGVTKERHCMHGRRIGMKYDVKFSI